MNLLQQNKNAFVESKSGEDENDDDEEIEKEPQTFLEVNKQDNHTKIFNKPIEKLTKTTGQIGAGNLSIEKPNDPTKKVAFLAFRNGVGKTLFSG